MNVLTLPAAVLAPVPLLPSPQLVGLWGNVENPQEQLLHWATGTESWD